MLERKGEGKWEAGGQGGLTLSASRGTRDHSSLAQAQQGTRNKVYALDLKTLAAPLQF